MSNQLINTRRASQDTAPNQAEKLTIKAANMVPFEDFTDFMTSFFDFMDCSDRTVIVAGHATPDIEIAADRAEMKVTEIIGKSPFVGDVADILDGIQTGAETIYLANPNWVTGTAYSHAGIEKIAVAVPRGRLILDEKYYDSCGITGLSLLADYPQIVILRSLSAGSQDRSEDSGYMLGASHLMHSLKVALDDRRGSGAFSASISHSLEDEDRYEARLKMLHDESLRVSTQLTRLGLQNRITPTDFLLLRVANPKQVGNYLARFNTPIENLDGYPGLKYYMKFRLRQPEVNDRLLEAIERMPAEFYKMSKTDKRPVRLQKPTQAEKRPANRLKADLLQS